MTDDTKATLERAGLQLIETAELIQEFAEMLGAEVVDLGPTVRALGRNSYGTIGGCERHNVVNCTRCEGGR